MRAAHFPTDPSRIRGICGTAARRASPDPSHEDYRDTGFIRLANESSENPN